VSAGTSAERELLLDHSAFSRLEASGLPAGRSAYVLDSMRARRLLVCLPFLLEAGYSARGMSDHVTQIDALRTLPHAAIDSAVEDRALQAQRQLAAVGHHRLSPPDLIVAALADARGVGVLHYDHDYDLIAKHTDLDFASEWLAPAGSL
jgi:predicted nucleic acid-binding protein